MPNAVGAQGNYSKHEVKQSFFQYDLSPYDLVCRQTPNHGWPGKLLSTFWALQVFVRVVLRNPFMPALDQLAFAILVILQIQKFVSCRGAACAQCKNQKLNLRRC